MFFQPHIDSRHMDTLKRILLVDDDAGIVELLSTALRNQGLIETSSTAEEALERLRQASYDVVVTDLKMPGIGGLELLRRVAELQPRTRVIVMSGQSQPF